MGESFIHNYLKLKVAEALQELGYETEVETSVSGGRADVLATAPDKQPIEVEIFKTSLPDRLVYILHARGEAKELIDNYAHHVAKTKVYRCYECGEQLFTRTKFCTPTCRNEYRKRFVVVPD